MFKFEFNLVEALPKLAWIAALNKKNKTIEVQHGKNVECGNNFFVAGVWDDEYKKVNFDKSTIFWGTGAKYTEGVLKFVTPSHAMERLLFVEREYDIIISNSLPFIMEYVNYDLDEKINQYESILCSMIFGPNGVIEDIPLKNGNIIKQYIVSNICIDHNLNINIERRPKLLPFKDFNDYYNRLMFSMKNLEKNLNSIDRLFNQYNMVTTISSGYDSCACAAVAKKIGCDTAISLTNGKYVNDNGRPIAEQLGYKNIIEKDCEEYKAKINCIDAEYVCSGELGTHLQFSVFEDILKDSLVFFGVRGCYWEKESKIDDNFEMKDHFYFETNVSWTENALRNGYIVAPIPTFGATQYSSIKKISVSEEMKPWSLGGKYDKPIPRRILESNGVKRNSFGMTKYGGGFSFWHDTKGTLKNKMSKDGYNSFLEYLRETSKKRIYVAKFTNGTKFYFTVAPIYANAILNKLGIKPIFKTKVPTISNPWVPSDLIFWGIKIMKLRYREQLHK